MKKFFGVFLVAICCLAMATPAQAQLLKWGLKGGLSMSKLDFKNGPTSDNTTGFFIGPMDCSGNWFGHRRCLDVLATW